MSASDRGEKRRASAAPSSKSSHGDVSGIELSENMFALKHLKGFREIDLDNDGTVTASEMKAILAKAGLAISDRDCKRYMEEIDVSRDGTVSFQEYLEFAKRLIDIQNKSKGKGTRIPRSYLDPPSYLKFEALFTEAAGGDGHVSVSELQEFFASKDVHIPAERLQAIVQEVDEDKSGELELDEFLVLLIKAQGLKRRRVGPDQCAAAQLREEGWALGELKKVGYSCAALRQAGFSLLELMDVCSAKEFLENGIPLKELVNAGWDCTNAKEAGFKIMDLVNGGATVRKIRNAGFTDIASVVVLRKLNVEALRMKQGGFSLSELRTAGYSTAELRLAGFSSVSMAALEKLEIRLRDGNPLQRRSTLEIRKEADKKLRQAELERARTSPDVLESTPADPSASVSGTANSVAENGDVANSEV
eukprot:TRINITY_DN73405_c0_g1_i1.p1 TRINITY_DN73405_c0_g1~~TRINITY_DN73405_c0_g1_i1.p1  ORF type:complete len:419 (-),score=97.24 TRINITY_DN73405_c0_g1_i1:8-1264(-)